MRRLMHFIVTIITSSLTLLPASSAIAQSSSGTMETSSGDREVHFAVSGAFEHQLQTDTDSEGDFSLTRFFTGLNLKNNFSSELHFSFQFNYTLDSYDFGGEPFGGAVGGEPWQDVHNLATGAVFTWDLNNQWSLFGGPVLQFSRESGADWADSIIGGGIVGATWKVSDDFAIGGGLWILTQIEDDLRLFPVIVINWQLSENLRFANQTTATMAGRTGLELVYSAGDAWEFAAGAANQFSRFRLDGDGVAPDGVGQDESTPLWLRVSCDVNSNFRIDTFGGVNLGGELRLDDSSGDNISHADYDAAFFLGVNVRIRF